MQCRGICRLSVYKSQELLLLESIGKILVKLHSIISRWVFTQTVLKVRVTLVILRGTFPHIFREKPPFTFLTDSQFLLLMY